MSKSHSPASTSCTSVILEHSLGPLVRCMNIQNPSKTYILYNLQSANISRQCFFICSCFKGTMCSLRAGNECPRHSGHLDLYLIKSGKDQEHPTRSEQSDTRFSQIQQDSRAICDVLWWSMTIYDDLWRTDFCWKKLKLRKPSSLAQPLFHRLSSLIILLASFYGSHTGTAPALHRQAACVTEHTLVHLGFHRCIPGLCAQLEPRLFFAWNVIPQYGNRNSIAHSNTPHT
jgi:hypothetical protein